ncbi:DUF839 domain-containing protein [bacterium]|nr:DUF839 domain-containing protein [bacterium]
MAFRLTRRRFLRSAVSASLAFSGLGALNGCSDSSSNPDPLAGFDGFGELLPDPEGVMDLPAGFSYRLVSEWKTPMSDGFLQPALSDGMHAFAGPNGRTVLVRNHELYSDPINLGAFGEGNRLLPQVDRSKVYDWGNGKPALGGTTTIVYDTRTQSVEEMFLSLVGTTRNCAGGATPWGSWVTCEEFVSLPNTVGLEKRHGFNFEVPASARGLVEPVALEAMGRFNHEAIAVDPETGIVYQTEDRYESLFYRFIPNVPGELAAGGRLQALVAIDRPALDTRNFKEAVVPVGERIPVRWIDLEDIASPNDDLRLRGASDGAAIFARGEGVVTGADGIYFSATAGGRRKSDTIGGTGQIWRYVPSPAEGTPDEERAPGTLELVFEPDDDTILDMGDNIVVSPWGDLFICEDGESDKDSLVVLRPNGTFYRFATNMLDQSEFAGVTFSPDDSTMFVNYQWSGKTFAITGPWPRMRG